MMKKTVFYQEKTTLSFFLLCFIFIWVTPAWSRQEYGGPEALVCQQLGHLLFFSGMVYLLVRIYFNRLSGSGWSEFKGFLWLIILWNGLILVGYWLEKDADIQKFIMDSEHIVGFSILSVKDLIYYLSRLDHLLLLPAFLLLLITLKRWTQTEANQIV